MAQLALLVVKDGANVTTFKVVKLSSTELRRGLKVGFEVVSQLVADGRVATFGIVLAHVEADFKLGLGQTGKAAAIV